MKVFLLLAMVRCRIGWHGPYIFGSTPTVLRRCVSCNRAWRNSVDGWVEL